MDPALEHVQQARRLIADLEVPRQPSAQPTPMQVSSLNEDQQAAVNRFDADSPVHCCVTLHLQEPTFATMSQLVQPKATDRPELMQMLTCRIVRIEHIAVCLTRWGFCFDLHHTFGYVLQCQYFLSCYYRHAFKLVTQQQHLQSEHATFFTLASQPGIDDTAHTICLTPHPLETPDYTPERPDSGRTSKSVGYSAGF